MDMTHPMGAHHLMRVGRALGLLRLVGLVRRSAVMAGAMGSMAVASHKRAPSIASRAAELLAHQKDLAVVHEAR